MLVILVFQKTILRQVLAAERIESLEASFIVPGSNEFDLEAVRALQAGPVKCTLFQQCLTN